MYAGERVEFLALQGLHLVPHGTELLPPCTRATTAVSVVVTNYRVLLQFLGLTRDKKTRHPVSIPLMSITGVQRGSTSSEALALRQETISSHTTAAGTSNGAGASGRNHAGSTIHNNSMFNTSTDFNNPYATPNPVNAATGAVDPLAFTGDPLLWTDIATKQGYVYRLGIRQADTSVQFVASLFDNELASQAVKEQQALAILRGGGASSPNAGKQRGGKSSSSRDDASSHAFTSMAFSPVREMMSTITTDLLTSSSDDSSSSDGADSDIEEGATKENRRLFKKKRAAAAKSPFASSNLASVVSAAGATAPSFVYAQPAATVSDMVDAHVFMCELVKAIDRAIPRKFTDFFAFSHYAALRNAALTMTLEKALLADAPPPKSAPCSSASAASSSSPSSSHQQVMEDCSERLRSLEQTLINHYAANPNDWQPPGMKRSVRLSIVGSLGLPSAADALLMGLGKTLPTSNIIGSTAPSCSSAVPQQPANPTGASPSSSSSSRLPCPQQFAKDLAKCHDSGWGAFNVLRSLYRMTVADVPHATEGVGLSTNLLQWFHIVELVGGRSLAAAMDTAASIPPVTAESIMGSGSSPTGTAGAGSNHSPSCVSAAVEAAIAELALTTDAERRLLGDVVHDAEVTKRSCCSMRDLLLGHASLPTADLTAAVCAPSSASPSAATVTVTAPPSGTGTAAAAFPVLCAHHSRTSKALGAPLLAPKLHQNQQPQPQQQPTLSPAAAAYVPVASHPQMAVANANDLRATFSTYPTAVILPKRASNIDTITACAKYRQNGRIPSISWIHIDTGAALARSSQPRVGGGRNSRDDQLMLSYLNQALHAEEAAVQHYKDLERRRLLAVEEANRRAKSPGNGNNGTAANNNGSGAAGGPSAAADASPQRAAGGRAPPPSLVGRSAALPPPSLFAGTGATPLSGNTAGSGASAFDGRSVSLSTATGASPSHVVTTLSINSSNNGGGAFSSSSPSVVGGVLVGSNSAPIVEDRMLHILDCRSVAAATTNMAAGGGYELVQNYQRAKIHFMNLDNIHGVRKAFERLTRLVQQTQCGDTAAMPRALRQKMATSTGNMTMLDSTSSSNDSSSAGAAFQTRLEATDWPMLVQRLLWSATKCCGYLQRGDSVLVHCTDGWDRTSQVVTLSMIMLDAHYRTIEGFCELLQREWLEYGHRFADRCGHYRKGASSSSSSGAANGDDAASASSLGADASKDGIATVLLSDTATLINKYTLMAAAERRHNRDERRRQREVAAEEKERRLQQELDAKAAMDQMQAIIDENGLVRDSSIYVPAEENPLFSASPPENRRKPNAFGPTSAAPNSGTSNAAASGAAVNNGASNNSGEPTKRQQFAALGTQQPPPLIRSVSDGRFQTKGSSSAVGPRVSGKEHEQTSPVFIQFLDAVYQLLRMFPSQFEFTPYFLSYLCEQVYGCRFGTFLMSCHRDRVQEHKVPAKAYHKAKQAMHLQQQQKAFQRKARAELRVAEAKERERLARMEKGDGGGVGDDENDDDASSGIPYATGRPSNGFDLVNSFSNFDANGQLLGGSINSKSAVGLPTFEDVPSCCLRDGQYAALATTTASVWGEVEELVLRERLYPHLVPDSDRMINLLFDASRHVPMTYGDNGAVPTASRPTVGRSTGPAPHTASPLIPSVQPRHYYFWNTFFAKPHSHFTDFWYSLSVLDAGYGPLGYAQFAGVGHNAVTPFNVGISTHGGHSAQGGDGGGSLAAGSSYALPHPSFGPGPTGGEPDNVATIIAMFLAASRLGDVYKSDGEQWMVSLKKKAAEVAQQQLQLQGNGNGGGGGSCGGSFNQQQNSSSGSLFFYNPQTSALQQQGSQQLLLPTPAPHLLGFLFHMFRHRAHVLQMLLPTAAVAGVHPDSTLALAAKRIQLQNQRRAELLRQQQEQQTLSKKNGGGGNKKSGSLLDAPPASSARFLSGAGARKASSNLGGAAEGSSSTANLARTILTAVRGSGHSPAVDAVAATDGASTPPPQQALRRNHHHDAHHNRGGLDTPPSACSSTRPDDAHHNPHHSTVHHHNEHNMSTTSTQEGGGGGIDEDGQHDDDEFPSPISPNDLSLHQTPEVFRRRNAGLNAGGGGAGGSGLGSAPSTPSRNIMLDGPADQQAAGGGGGGNQYASPSGGGGGGGGKRSRPTAAAAGGYGLDAPNGTQGVVGDRPGGHGDAVVYGSMSSDGTSSPPMNNNTNNTTSFATTTSDAEGGVGVGGFTSASAIVSPSSDALGAMLASDRSIVVANRGAGAARRCVVSDGSFNTDVNGHRPLRQSTQQQLVGDETHLMMQTMRRNENDDRNGGEEEDGIVSRPATSPRSSCASSSGDEAVIDTEAGEEREGYLHDDDTDVRSSLRIPSSSMTAQNSSGLGVGRRRNSNAALGGSAETSSSHNLGGVRSGDGFSGGGAPPRFGNRNGGVLRSDFIPRSTANNCEVCLVAFTFFNRRHCCRRCCRATCDRCSAHAVLLAPEEIGLFEERAMTKVPLRVCTQCFEQRRDTLEE